MYKGILNIIDRKYEHLFGVIDYKDVYGNSYKTHFCFYRPLLERPEMNKPNYLELNVKK